MIVTGVIFLTYTWILVFCYIITADPVFTFMDSLNASYIASNAGWFNWFIGMCKFTYSFIFVLAILLGFLWLFVWSTKKEVYTEGMIL